MTLIKSISGIRGTIGGRPGDGLSPLDVVKFTSGFGTWIRRKNQDRSLTVVVGRDGRSTGGMVSGIVISTLQALGINVIDLGLATTPTVEIAVTGTGASGGIIITASHNPANWNALKLLNEKGEFLSETDGNEVLSISAEEDFDYATHDKTGNCCQDDSWDNRHIDQILSLDIVNVEAIRKSHFKVVVDCINSVGGVVLPKLFKRLGIEDYILLNGVPDGNFAHNPEPLEENLSGIMKAMTEVKADLGFVVDPDVDRLAIICEDGSMFGEEYTLVAVSDYILSRSPGNTVSNMSSTRALRDITEKHGGKYFSSAVGEVNVVEEMKKRNAVIGGEGNGGVIYPALHYGRDALAGIALFLSHLSEKGVRCRELRRSYPDYFMAKKKVVLQPGTDTDAILNSVKELYSNEKVDDRDGIKIDFATGWVHIRKSNTEPILRIYAEGRSEDEADQYASGVIDYVKKH